MVFLGFLVLLLFYVAWVIGIGVIHPMPFACVLIALQVTACFLIGPTLKRITLKQLFSFILIVAAAWGIAAPGVRRSLRTNAFNRKLSAITSSIDYRRPLNRLGVLIPSTKLQRWIDESIVREPYHVFLREKDEREICDAAQLLADFEFDGRLNIDTTSCTDKCLDAISEISALQELSIRAVAGPTDKGMSNLLDKLDLGSLKLTAKSSMYSNHPHSLEMHLFEAYERENVSWAVTDSGLSNIGQVRHIEIHGLPIDGTFLDRHKALDKVNRLNFRSTLVGRSGTPWMKSLSRLSVLSITGSPIGNEVINELVELAKVLEPNVPLHVNLNSTLINDEGIKGLLVLEGNEFNILRITANVNSSSASSITNHFSRSRGCFKCVVKRRPPPNP